MSHIVAVFERNIGTPDKRRALRRHWAAFEAWCAERDRFERRHGSQSFTKELPEYPDECRGLECGAKARAGTPCKQKALYVNGRCKFHGGASTGPRTKKGKARSARNGLNPKRRKRTSWKVRRH